MMSKRKMYESKIYTICQTSGDVNINDRFNGVKFMLSVFHAEYYAKTPCICIGKIGDSERVFVTEDKLCYFSVTDGWGVNDGYIFALNLGFEFKHDKPMGIYEIKEFVANTPEAHGFTSHMKKGLEIGVAKKIIKLLENTNQ